MNDIINSMQKKLWLRIDNKRDDGETTVLDIRGMWSTSPVRLFPGLLWLEVVVPVRMEPMGQRELINHEPT